MKNILYSLLAFILLSNTAFAQLMTDEQHRTMINNYTTALNNILTPYATQQGISIDELKKNIVNGQFSLANETSNITTAAAPLRTYGYQFASAKGLTILPNDNRAYFYATFAPSTVVSNGKLIESTTTAGITATEMWQCALSSFNTSNCGGSVLVSDKNDISKLATASINKLNANTMNVLLMVNGNSNCLSSEVYKNLMRSALNESVILVFNNAERVNDSCFIDRNSYVTGLVTLMNEKLNGNFQIAEEDKDAFADVIYSDWNLSDVINDIDGIAYLGQEQKIIFKDFASALDRMQSDTEVLNVTNTFSRNVSENTSLNSSEKYELQNIFDTVTVMIELGNKNEYTDTASKWNGGIDLSRCKLPNGRLASLAGVSNGIKGAIAGCVASAAAGCVHGAAVGGAVGFVKGFSYFCAASLINSCFGYDVSWLL